MANFGTQHTWVFPAILFSALLGLLLISGAVVLALIPLYLPQKDITVTRNTTTTRLNVAYSTDASDGSTLTVSDTSSLLSQLSSNTGIASKYLSLQSGGFSTATASNSRKRDRLSAKPTCQGTNGLTGNIFVAALQIEYPLDCITTACQERFLKNSKESLQMRSESKTFSMALSDGQSRTVRMKFCSFFDTDAIECTSITKNSQYFISNLTLYRLDIANFTMTRIGPMNCPSTESFYTSTLSSTGLIWILMQSRRIYTYNVTTGKCIETAQISNYSLSDFISMSFVKNEVDNTESLYFADRNMLRIMDMNRYRVSNNANFTNATVVSILGGTDGKLYGLRYSGVYFYVQEINKTNADVGREYRLPVDDRALGIGYFPYGPRFLLYMVYANYTDIFLYEHWTNTTFNKLGTYSILPYPDISASVCFGT